MTFVSSRCSYLYPLYVGKYVIIRCMTMIPQNMMMSWMNTSAKISTDGFSGSASGENLCMDLFKAITGIIPMKEYCTALMNSAFDSSDPEKTWEKNDFLLKGKEEEE